MDFEAMYNESERIYNEEYSTGEYCHEQSFKWGFQEGFQFSNKKMIDNVYEWLDEHWNDYFEENEDFNGWRMMRDFRKAMEE